MEELLDWRVITGVLVLAGAWYFINQRSSSFHKKRLKRILAEEGLLMSEEGVRLTARSVGGWRTIRVNLYLTGKTLVVVQTRLFTHIRLCLPLNDPGKLQAESVNIELVYQGSVEGFISIKLKNPFSRHLLNGMGINPELRLFPNNTAQWYALIKERQ